MKSLPAIHAIGLVLLVSLACGESRRVGGSGNGTPAPPRRADATVDAGDEGEDGGPTQPGRDAEPIEGRDATVETPRDAEPMVTPTDAGFPSFDAMPPPPDAGFPADVGFPGFPDASQPRDSGTIPMGPDSGQPPLQTQVTAVPGTAVAVVGSSDFDFSVTLQFDNAGPGSQALTVTRAELTIVIVGQTFSLTPSSHSAPVGSSQRTFSKVPGSGNPPSIDPTLLLLACAGIGVPVPGILTIEFSNGAFVSVLDASVSCAP